MQPKYFDHQNWFYLHRISNLNLKNCILVMYSKSPLFVLQFPYTHQDLPHYQFLKTLDNGGQAKLYLLYFHGFIDWFMNKIIIFKSLLILWNIFAELDNNKQSIEKSSFAISYMIFALNSIVKICILHTL